MARAKNSRGNNSTTTATSTNVTPINRKGTVENVAPESKKAANGNLDEEIRRRAYELYEQRGGEHGRAQEDWFRAEAEVRARTNTRTA
jgi:Protein of unknown function (DUF2934)